MGYLLCPLWRVSSGPGAISAAELGDSDYGLGPSHHTGNRVTYNSLLPRSQHTHKAHHSCLLVSPPLWMDMPHATRDTAPWSNQPMFEFWCVTARGPWGQLISCSIQMLAVLVPVVAVSWVVTVSR